jgi:hypothetical protein
MDCLYARRRVASGPAQSQLLVELERSSKLEVEISGALYGEPGWKSEAKAIVVRLILGRGGRSATRVLKL